MELAQWLAIYRLIANYLTFAPRNHNKSYGLKGRKTRMNTGFLV